MPSPYHRSDAGLYGWTDEAFHWLGTLDTQQKESEIDLAGIEFKFGDWVEGTPEPGQPYVRADITHGRGAYVEGVQSRWLVPPKPKTTEQQISEARVGDVIIYTDTEGHAVTAIKTRPGHWKSFTEDNGIWEVEMDDQYLAEDIDGNGFTRLEARQ